MRPSRIWAIARRDWALQLGRGRSSIALPAIAALLLGPIAIIPPTTPPDPALRRLTVSGDVPDEVRASPEVIVRKQNGEVTFERDEAGQPRVVTRWLSDPIRDTLDQLTPAGPHPRVVDVRIERPLPSRSLIVALITGSILTGAVAEALPGERSRRTLETLLAAAVTRLEIVVGKWLAWGGFGVLACLAATAVSVGFGRQALGPWAAAAPLVPLGTVAAGLYLVRQSTDVVGGSTIAIRVLPAALAGLGILAGVLGELVSPWAGAAVPLGGALVAAGDLWGAGPTLLAAGTTAIPTAWALYATAADLGVDGGANATSPGRTFALASTAVGAIAWWTATITPALWTAAGNPHVGEDMGPERAALAGVFTFGTLAIVAYGRPDHPAWRAWRTPARAVGGALLGAVVLAAVPSGAGLWKDPIWAEIAQRMHADIFTVGLAIGLALPLILASEAWFRGALRDRVGPIGSAVAWWLAVAPLDPIGGLLSAVVLGAAAETGGVIAAIGARIGAYAIGAWVTGGG